MKGFGSRFSVDVKPGGKSSSHKPFLKGQELSESAELKLELVPLKSDKGMDAAGFSGDHCKERAAWTNSSSALFRETSATITSIVFVFCWVLRPEQSTGIVLAAASSDNDRQGDGDTLRAACRV